jgi:hypothetical protein
MSGRTIPYHLRQNKSVERFAFVELLSRISRLLPIETYRYIGFGGLALEDFKFVHARLGLSKMTSIEMNSNVLKRQKFNKPLHCIELNMLTSQELISNLPVGGSDEQLIVWLDYTSPSELRSQLDEFQMLMSRLRHGDVVKITLNAAPSALKEQSSLPKGSSTADLYEARYNELIARLGIAPLSDSIADDMRAAEYPQVLKRCIRYFALEGLKGRKEYRLQPLSSFVYSDPTQMFTFTGVILDNAMKPKEFEMKTGIKKWPLSTLTWDGFKRIDVPDFTMRERLFIDAMLPGKTAKQIQKRLGYWVADSVSESQDMIETYRQFYRHVMPLSKILL